MKTSTQIFFFIGLFYITSCKINYTFSGASYSADIKTYQVNHFENKAPLVYPPLSNILTENLKEKINQLTKLKLSNDGDIKYEGTIIDYKIVPSAISGNNNASLNRLSISVLVKFTNTKNYSQNFEKTFTHYADFDASKNFTSIEADLVKEITEKIINDIFNASLVNW
ncbi:MAG: LPS assembly lipoprotein LptE [Bacteroidales bacterium]|nr:LPS assembly lipoprotein LptE [Bacteroidales bacterium]